jgi:2'-5' RNA ligase
MTDIRAFIAIELPTSIQQQLNQIIRALQAKCRPGSLRWVPVANIHLTLQFLGDVPSSNVDAITRVLASETARHAATEVSVGGLGAFPNPRRPRVIWIGLSKPAGLVALQKGIENGLSGLGYPPEERPFSPHLTLARLSQNANPEAVGQVSDALAASRVGDLGIVPVTHVHLFRSDLRPTGAIYTRLFSAPLSAING